MPTTVPVDSSGLPVNYCPSPATWEQINNDIAATLTVDVPDVAGFAAQATPPATSLIWVETSVSAPYVKSIRAYAGADWRRIPAPPTQVYFQDSGAANNVTISTGELMSSEVFLIGRIFVIRLNNAPTGATTLTVDSIPAKSLYKTGTTVIESGDFAAGQLLMVGYDDTSDHFEILTSFGAVTSPYKVAVVKFTGAAGTAAQIIPANSATTVSLNTLVDPAGFVNLNSSQVELPIGTYLLDFSSPIFVPATSASSSNVIMLLRDVTAGGTILATGTSYNAGGDGDTSSVRVTYAVTVSGSANTFDVQCYAKTSITHLGVAANQGSYTETYQQLTITKIA